MSRQLAGFRFESVPPPIDETMPRMDVAAFVGFAARGPLHLPVVVEDVAHYEAVFGGELPLAWDTTSNQTVNAYLPGAVRAFFRNGGRRCWVVRVADDQAAIANQFPLVGVLALQVGQSNLAPALVQARSKGSWSDSLKISEGLLVQALKLVAADEKPFTFADDTLTCNLELDKPDALIEGDMLRLSWSKIGVFVYGVVAQKEVLPPSTTTPKLRDTANVKITLQQLRWFTDRLPVNSLVSGATLYHSSPIHPTDSYQGESAPFHEQWVQENDKLIFLVDGQQTALLNGAKFEIGLIEKEQQVTLGSLIKLEVALSTGETVDVWVRADDVVDHRALGTTNNNSIEIRGEALCLLAEQPVDLGADAPQVECLTIELFSQQQGGDIAELVDVALAPKHPRYISTLPDDNQYFKASVEADNQVYRSLADYPELAGDESKSFYPGSLQEALLRKQFWRDGQGFPATGEAGAVYYPILVPKLNDLYLRRIERLLPNDETETTLHRDGLTQFKADLFIDASLKDAGLFDLSERADWLRFYGTQTRDLRGIHSLFGIEEVSLIAVPDAIHNAWDYNPPLVLPDKPSTNPDTPKIEEPIFVTCAVLELGTGVWVGKADPDASGTFELVWNMDTPWLNDIADATQKEAEQNKVIYVLEEARNPTFIDSVEIFRKHGGSFRVYGHSPGVYYYRVRVEYAGMVSQWSENQRVTVPQAIQWQVVPPTHDKNQLLIDVHTALLRFCAVRGDLFAVLSLPAHYRETDALRHRDNFVPQKWNSLSTAIESVPLSGAETIVLSYGALYHPWLTVRENGDPVNLPPDGAVLGTMAKRAQRGAWVAPASERLQGVLELYPAIASDAPQRFLDAQVNLIRRTPNGYMLLSADTLSGDPMLRPISVRRLLILLRRMALKRGVNYVFEPNDDSFRRLLEREYEDLLQLLFQRGAFAGRTPAESFQVVVSNNDQQIERGQVVIELRVAPSLPLVFVIVRLLQSGAQVNVQEVV